MGSVGPFLTCDSGSGYIKNSLLNSALDSEGVE